MLKIGLIAVLIMGSSISAACADHLGFQYVLDAVLYQRTTPSGPALHFEAVQHPVWKSHEDEQRLTMINELCGKDQHTLRFGGSDVLAALPAVNITDPMNERQIVEMLAARAGLMDFDSKKANYTASMHFYRAQFPDQRYPLFNLTYRGVMREAGETTSSEQRVWKAVQWKQARQLKVKDYGSKKVIACIEKRVQTESYKWDGLIEEGALKQWVNALDCETEIAMINPKELFILPAMIQSKLATDVEPSEFMVPVSMDCFLGDHPCEE